MQKWLAVQADAHAVLAQLTGGFVGLKGPKTKNSALDLGVHLRNSV